MTELQTRDRPLVVSPPSVPVDPRIAARWESVRRDQGHRRHRRVVGALTVVTALTGGWVLARSPALSVHHVVVRGVRHTSRSSVLAAAGLGGHPMLDVDPNAVSSRVLALPWAGQVSVHRQWPATITIDVVERAAIAQVAGTAGQPAVVDSSGRVLAVGEEAAGVLGAAHPSLPVLQGVLPAAPGAPLAPGARLAPGAMLAPGSRAALAVLSALGGLRVPWAANRSGALPWVVTAVSREADGTVVASLSPGPVTVILGTTDQLDAKVLALGSVLAQLDAGAATTIDVRIADAPVLTDRKKSSSVSTTQRG